MSRDNDGRPLGASAHVRADSVEPDTPVCLVDPVYYANGELRLAAGSRLIVLRSQNPAWVVVSGFGRQPYCLASDALVRVEHRVRPLAADIGDIQHRAYTAFAEDFVEKPRPDFDPSSTGCYQAFLDRNRGKCDAHMPHTGGVVYAPEDGFVYLDEAGRYSYPEVFSTRDAATRARAEYIRRTLDTHPETSPKGALINLTELILSNTENAVRLRRALVARLLMDHPGLYRVTVKDAAALRELQTQYDARQAAYDKACEPGALWVVAMDQPRAAAARRHDGVRVHSAAIEVATLPVPWRMSVSGPGQIPTQYQLEATNLADAIAEADRRWPCPDWWLTVIPTAL